MCGVRGALVLGFGNEFACNTIDNHLNDVCGLRI
jgi:hypothetical protein